MHRVTRHCPDGFDKLEGTDWALGNPLLQQPGYAVVSCGTCKPGEQTLQQFVATGGLTQQHLEPLQQQLLQLCHLNHPHLVPCYGSYDTFHTLPRWVPPPPQPATAASSSNAATGAGTGPTASSSKHTAETSAAAAAGASKPGVATATEVGTGSPAVALAFELPKGGLMLYPNHPAATPGSRSSSGSSTLHPLDAAAASSSSSSSSTLHPPNAGGSPHTPLDEQPSGNTQIPAPARRPHTAVVTERQVVLHHLGGVLQALQHLNDKELLPPCVVPCQLWQGANPTTTSSSGTSGKEPVSSSSSSKPSKGNRTGPTTSSSSSSNSSRGCQTQCPAPVQLLPLVHVPGRKDSLLGMAAALGPWDVQYLAPEILTRFLQQNQQQWNQQQQNPQQHGPHSTQLHSTQQHSTQQQAGSTAETEVSAAQGRRPGSAPVAHQPQQRWQWHQGWSAAAAQQQPQRVRIVPEQAVVWSLGVLTHQLLLQHAPFSGDTPDQIYASMLNRTRRGVPLPLWLSDGAKDFLWRSLQLNPSRRLSLEGVLSHPWVKALSFQPSTAVDRYAARVQGSSGGVWMPEAVTRDSILELSAAQGAMLSQPLDVSGLLRQRADVWEAPRWKPVAAVTVGPPEEQSAHPVTKEKPAATDQQQHAQLPQPPQQEAPQVQQQDSPRGRAPSRAASNPGAAAPATLVPFKQPALAVSKRAAAVAAAVVAANVNVAGQHKQFVSNNSNGSGGQQSKLVNAGQMPSYRPVAVLQKEQTRLKKAESLRWSVGKPPGGAGAADAANTTPPKETNPTTANTTSSKPATIASSSSTKQRALQKQVSRDA